MKQIIEQSMKLEPHFNTQLQGEKMSMEATINKTFTLASFKAELRGNVYTPEDAGYSEACKAWNLNAVQRPVAVVMVETSEDVILAVRFASDASLGIGVMATGHGVGTQCDGGLLINTSKMRGVTVNPVTRTARVEAGALWKDVIPEAATHGLAGLVGSASHVGVVGYTMGGGFGWLGRKYGLNASSVTRAEVVTANGELLHASETHNADLFWGLKGGGGNFGVVTALEFKLYPLTTVYGGATFYPLEQAPRVLSQYARWSKNLPDEITTAVAFAKLPPKPSLPKPLQGQSVVVLKGCYCGEKPQDGAALFSPMREQLGIPIFDTFKEMSVSDMDAISMDPVDSIGVFQHRELLSDLSPATIVDLVTVAGSGSGSPLTVVEVRQLGGALERNPERLNPLGSGKARYSLNAIGATFSPEMKQPVKTHLARLAKATRPYQTSETFLNFMEVEPTLQRVRASYPTQDWQRLVTLKDKYDPKNLFRFNRNIPPTL
jgi:FAD/FMN-containing dehydrogenase